MTGSFGQPTVLDCRFPARLEEVDAACLQLRAFLAVHGLSARAFAVELTTRECLNNAVLHGSAGDARWTVSLTARLGPRWLRVCVTDQGPGFPWRRQRHVPDADQSHGRGQSILRLHAHKVAFNTRGNSVTLWFDRHPPQPHGRPNP